MDMEDIISVLMESPIYLDIPLRERYGIIKHVLLHVTVEETLHQTEEERVVIHGA